MNRVVRHILLTLIALATLGLYGCANEQGEKREKRERPDKLEVVSLDKVKGNINDGLKVTLTVKNNTGYNVRLSEVDAFLQYKDRKIGRLAVEGDVVLPRRVASQVEVPIRVTVPSLFTALAALKRINQKLYDGFVISYNATVKAGGLKFKMKNETASLEEFVKDFNQGFQNKK